MSVQEGCADVACACCGAAGGDSISRAQGVVVMGPILLVVTIGWHPATAVAAERAHSCGPHSSPSPTLPAALRPHWHPQCLWQALTRHTYSHTILCNACCITAHRSSLSFAFWPSWVCCLALRLALPPLGCWKTSSGALRCSVCCSIDRLLHD